MNRGNNNWRTEPYNGSGGGSGGYNSSNNWRQESNFGMEEEVMAAAAPDTATLGDQNQTLVVKTTATAAADLVSEATTMAQTTAMTT